jgi:hypothetical protein
VAAYDSDGIEVLDISDPNNPIHTGSLQASGSIPLYGAYDLVKNGNYLYVVSETSDSLTVIDVSTPTSPTYSTSIINSA